MKYTIDISGLPEGWEPVAHRKAMGGEPWWDGDTICDYQTCSSVLIIRPTWQPPDFIPDGWWVAKNSVGDWWAYERDPDWNYTGGEMFYIPHRFWPDAPDVHWKESKKQKVAE